jgi:osmotically-inducible protein OsmY
VVTERGIVYLMGIVTNAGATRAADLTRAINGAEGGACSR